MSSSAQKKLATRILKCGVSRVWFDPMQMSEITEALTAADIKALVRRGVIKKMLPKGTSNARKKKADLQRKKGRRKGIGSRKGRATARLPRKQSWMKRIRAIRKELVTLKTGHAIDPAIYRDLYVKAKSGFFRSRMHLRMYLERNNLLLNGEPCAETKTTEKDQL